LFALLGAALLKVGALQICPMGSCRALSWEIGVLHGLHALRSPALDNFFLIVTWLGSLYLLLPIAIVVALLDRRASSVLQRWFVPLALCSTWAAIHGAKILVARARPEWFDALITLPADGSYPSAHAAQITAFACAWILRPGYRVPAPVVASLFVTMLTVAVSRLYLQVHYPSDVIYGMAATTLWVTALYFVVMAGKGGRQQSPH
jgi:membrane-associated phospholipid phosphatase